MGPRRRIFVCVQNRPIGHPLGSCHGRSGGLVYRTFLEELQRQSAAENYQLTACGCLGPCAQGAIVIVYPEGILYGRVLPSDVPEIVQQHVVSGVPVARLVIEDAAT
jgi:(2Fe-2S) ferredoxin